MKEYTEKNKQYVKGVSYAMTSLHHYYIYILVDYIQNFKLS